MVLSTNSAAFRDAVMKLHRMKNASYGNAWKKRGEVLSILANLARKIDRLEYVLAGAPATRDEALLDTAIDLLVYCLKYQTYLADSDTSAADNLFAGSNVHPPYSDEPAGFEYLLMQLNLPETHVLEGNASDTSVKILSRFEDLENCFQGLNSTQSAVARLRHVDALIAETLILLKILARDDGKSYRAFLASQHAVEDS